MKIYLKKALPYMLESLSCDPLILKYMREESRYIALKEFFSQQTEEEKEMEGFVLGNANHCHIARFLRSKIK